MQPAYLSGRPRTLLPERLAAALAVVRLIFNDGDDRSKGLRHILGFHLRQINEDVRCAHTVGHRRHHHSGQRDPQPADTRLAGRPS